MMTTDEQERVAEDVRQEGFDYTFLHYEDYRDIHDEQFHKLIDLYLDARAALADYVGFDPDEY